MEKIINSCELQNCWLEIVEKVSKSGNMYLCCMLCNDNGKYKISFDTKVYYSIKNYLGGK